jgi:glutamate dehydrogenase (NADP+)
MLTTQNDSLEGKVCLVSGSGNVAQYTAEKVIELGGKVVTMSDSSGYIYDEEGIDRGKLDFVMRLKNTRRGRIQEYIDKYSEASYTEADGTLDYNPLWDHKADCAFPSATQNEINGKDAANLVKNGVKLISEGANMPSTPEAIDVFLDNKLLYAPGKAANAGGVAVSCLEMAQNRMLLTWSAEEVDQRLRTIMKHIHGRCREVAAEFGAPDNYAMGANIAGFLRVVNAMQDQGIV